MTEEIVKYLLIFGAFCILIAFLNSRLKKKEKEPKSNTDYTNGYKSKWLFSNHEKEAFYKIKEITDSMSLYLFSKVRLFDLVEPKQGIENKLGHQGKIQAKHVDFVICDKKLVARMIIELDDASHDTQPREERDNFVDAVLLSCGYKVLHIRSVEPDTLKAQLESVFNTASATL